MKTQRSAISLYVLSLTLLLLIACSTKIHDKTNSLQRVSSFEAMQLQPLDDEDMSGTVLPSVTENPTFQEFGRQWISNQCDASLWDHVYNPERLHVLAPCIAITGVIVNIKKEKDGDDHIQLKVDPEYHLLLNETNITQLNDSLILEPMCINRVTQGDAAAACLGYKSNFAIPGVGTHVKVVGSYVVDTRHGWNEIHPVSAIESD